MSRVVSLLLLILGRQGGYVLSTGQWYVVGRVLVYSWLGWERSSMCIIRLSQPFQGDGENNNTVDRR